MLVAEGVGVAEISRVMGKTLVSVRSKMYHLGLSVVDAAAVFPTIAVSVASIASVASTPKPTIDHAPLDHAPSQVPIIYHQPAASSASAPVLARLMLLRLSKRMNPYPALRKTSSFRRIACGIRGHMHRTKF